PTPSLHPSVTLVPYTTLFRSCGRQAVKAVVADFSIVGEASNNVPEAVIDAHPELPWRAMVEMRNVVVHAYFDVDPRLLWKTIEKDRKSTRLNSSHVSISYAVF